MPKKLSESQDMSTDSIDAKSHKDSNENIRKYLGLDA